MECLKILERKGNRRYPSDSRFGRLFRKKVNLFTTQQGLAWIAMEEEAGSLSTSCDGIEERDPIPNDICIFSSPKYQGPVAGVISPKSIAAMGRRYERTVSNGMSTPNATTQTLRSSVLPPGYRSTMCMRQSSREAVMNSIDSYNASDTEHNRYHTHPRRQTHNGFAAIRKLSLSTPSGLEAIPEEDEIVSQCSEREKSYRTSSESESFSDQNDHLFCSSLENFTTASPIPQNNQIYFHNLFKSPVTSKAPQNHMWLDNTILDSESYGTLRHRFENQKERCFYLNNQPTNMTQNHNHLSQTGSNDNSKFSPNNSRTKLLDSFDETLDYSGDGNFRRMSSSFCVSPGANSSHSGHITRTSATLNYNEASPIVKRTYRYPPIQTRSNEAHHLNIESRKTDATIEDPTFYGELELKHMDFADLPGVLSEILV